MTSSPMTDAKQTRLERAKFSIKYEHFYIYKLFLNKILPK
jgi:hypothetical protein